MPTYIGIDPGLHGGMAILKGTDVRLVATPDTPQAAWDIISGYGFGIYDHSGVHAVLELVPHSIFGGAKSSSAKLYGSFKAIEMALVAAEIPHTLVTAKKWQPALGVEPRHKDETDSKWKGRLQTKARQLFPLRKITRETSDALLLAEYCRRFHEGKL